MFHLFSFFCLYFHVCLNFWLETFIKQNKEDKATLYYQLTQNRQKAFENTGEM